MFVSQDHVVSIKLYFCLSKTCVWKVDSGLESINVYALRDGHGHAFPFIIGSECSIITVLIITSGLF